MEMEMVERLERLKNGEMEKERCRRFGGYETAKTNEEGYFMCYIEWVVKMPLGSSEITEMP